MAKFGGIALKSISLFIRTIQFGCSVVILGIFAYFLASLSNHNLPINNHIRATEGISGAATLYTIVGFLFVCCLGGVAFLGFISILLDFAFAGAFGYLAWVNRAGASRCSGVVNTPYGRGNVNGGNRIEYDDGKFTTVPSFYTACRLQTACFAVAIVGGYVFPFPTSLTLLVSELCTNISSQCFLPPLHPPLSHAHQASQEREGFRPWPKERLHGWIRSSSLLAAQAQAR